ncbi:hypothetical protein D3C84_1220160 [compost metagenome]
MLALASGVRAARESPNEAASALPPKASLRLFVKTLRWIIPKIVIPSVMPSERMNVLVEVAEPRWRISK